MYYVKEKGAERFQVIYCQDPLDKGLVIADAISTLALAKHIAKEFSESEEPQKFDSLKWVQSGNKESGYEYHMTEEINPGKIKRTILFALISMILGHLSSLIIAGVIIGGLMGRIDLANAGIVTFSFLFLCAFLVVFRVAFEIFNLVKELSHEI
jgi:hypothetical protein